MQSSWTLFHSPAVCPGASIIVTVNLSSAVRTCNQETGSRETSSRAAADCNTKGLYSPFRKAGNSVWAPNTSCGPLGKLLHLSAPVSSSGNRTESSGYEAQGGPGIGRNFINCNAGLRGVCAREAAAVCGLEHCFWSREIWDGILAPVAYSLCSLWASFTRKEGRVITRTAAARRGCGEDGRRWRVSQAAGTDGAGQVCGARRDWVKIGGCIPTGAQ